MPYDILEMMLLRFIQFILILTISLLGSTLGGGNFLFDLAGLHFLFLLYDFGLLHLCLRLSNLLSRLVFILSHVYVFLG